MSEEESIVVDVGYPIPSNAEPIVVSRQNAKAIWTCTCSMGHELKLHGGVRKQLIKADTVRNVMDVAWCDVCVEPMHPDEAGGRCPQEECNFDACYRCCDIFKANYLFTIDFITGPQKDAFYSNYVAGTLDVRKDLLKQVLEEESDEDRECELIKVPGAILEISLDLCLTPWGTDKESRETFATSIGSAYFNRANGELMSIEIVWTNPILAKHQRDAANGVGMVAVGFNREIPKFNMFVPQEVKDNLNTPWIVYACQAQGEEVKTGYGVFSTLRRYALGEVPGFSWTKEKFAEGPQWATTKLLKAVANQKRAVLDPLRDYGQTKLAKSSWFPKFNGAFVVKGKDVAKLQKIRNKNEEETEALMSKLDLKKAFTKDRGRQAGGVHHSELVYCARLSVMAYLINPVSFEEFFPPERETMLIDPVWQNFIANVENNEGKEFLRQYIGKSNLTGQALRAHAHEAFLAKFVSDFFVSDPKENNYGMSRRLGVVDGPLFDLDLEFYEIPRSPSMRRKWVTKAGAFKFKSTEGFIAKSKDFESIGGDIIIAFQGTTKFVQFFVSMNGVTTPFEPLVDGNDPGFCACLQGRGISASDATKEGQANKLRVHLGFYKAFLGVKQEIEEAIFTLLSVVPKDKPVRILITGHSLGGALALLCSAWLMLWLDPDFKGESRTDRITTEMNTQSDILSIGRLRIVTVTFGAPKVGTPEFVEWMDNHRFVRTMSAENKIVRMKIIRIMDLMDPIITLPPTARPFDYEHTLRHGASVTPEGLLVFLNKSNAQSLNSTRRGIRVILVKGRTVMFQHDIFRYLRGTLHFAWKINLVDEHGFSNDDPIKLAFGDGTEHFHDFTRSPAFLKDF